MPLTSSSSFGSFGPSTSASPALDLLAVGDLEVGALGHQHGVLLAAVGHHRDVAARLVLDHPGHARVAGEHRGTLRGAGLEQLDHAGEPVGDVLTDDAAGVEGPHGELGTGLTDRLRGDHPDRLAEFDETAGRQRLPVAGRADALLGLAGEHRPHPDPVDPRVVAEPTDQVVGEQRPRLQGGAVGEGDRLGGDPAVRPGLEVRAACRAVGHDALDPDATGRAAVLLADDELLGDVDQAPGEIARVGGPEGGVGEALSGAVGRDEVLEDREALSERGLDRPGDHFAPRVGHQALHAGDLADLLAVPSSTRVDHHVERVERDGRERLLHGLADLGVRRGPDLDLLLAPLVVGDDARA